MSGLRVVDAAVLPTLPSGNTNAAVTMVAERAAHLIQQEWQQLHPATLPTIPSSPVTASEQRTVAGSVKEEHNDEL